MVKLRNQFLMMVELPKSRVGWAERAKMKPGYSDQSLDFNMHF
jgi:hypothetical protein